jgi:tRNA nucleotidyltransferase (CCA-adding enzyme)
MKRYLVGGAVRDLLRVFRIARFAAQFPDFSVHPATLNAMREAAANRLLESLPAERVRRETLKALAAPLPSRFLLLLSNAGCLHPWFAECAGMRERVRKNAPKRQPA